ncbi:Asp-tRNA(Asn)/Glu-tRNA(Gln) amidotransferase subunit GatA [candidate division WWE3 bacterium]|nr:Asp-tRNA(Asn)/Glu-tRNA(Gln) amidotransferase subunit GatA [candidate division WWE3 bacterium]
MNNTKNTNYLTLLDSITKLKSGEISSTQLVEDCFSQIERFDPELKAFIYLQKATALKEAELADKKIKNQGVGAFSTQPLLGIPYACKDNFSTLGVQTTASSSILKNYIPPFESTVTKKLKDAGAIMLGKTNMDAFAHGSSTENSDFFPTKNPWDKTRVPGGSSGGSAVAVASNMCIFAIGSETAGSIRGPAVWCGVTGLKPTYGRVSRYGVVAMASSTDSPGLITKSVMDSAQVLSLIAGKDEFDATTSPEKPSDYFSQILDFNIKGMKIGIPKSYFTLELEDGVRLSVEGAIKKLEDLGATIVEIDLLDPKYSIGVYTILQRSEVSSNLARLDGIRYGGPRTQFGFEAKKRMMLGAYVLSAGYYDQYYAKAQKVRTLILEDFNNAYKKVDVILGPTMPGIAPELGAADASPLFGELADILQEPSSIAGLCAVTVPCGFSQGLPVGFQLIGNYFDENKVLGISYVYQQHTDFHTKFPTMGEK